MGFAVFSEALLYRPAIQHTRRTLLTIQILILICFGIINLGYSCI